VSANDEGALHVGVAEQAHVVDRTPGRDAVAQRAQRKDAPFHREAPDSWPRLAPRKNGSWWSEWQSWLVAPGSGRRIPPPPMGAPEKGLPPLEDAPGRYVHMR